MARMRWVQALLIGRSTVAFFHGYRSTVLLPLGYRQEEGDWLLKLKKVRTPKEAFVTELTLADVAALEDQPLAAARQG
jgi:nitroreductase